MSGEMGLAKRAQRSADIKQTALQMVGSRTGMGYNGSASTSGTPTVSSRTKHEIFGAPDSLQIVLAGCDLVPVAERVSPTNAYRVRRAAINAAGSGYVANEIVTLAAGNPSPAKVRVIAVSSGAITLFEIVDPGFYTTAVASLAQASTSGSGTGATFNVDWEGCAWMARLSIEPDFAAATTQSGAKAYKRAQVGVLSDGSRGTDLIVKPGQFTITDPIPVRAPVDGTDIALRMTTFGIGVPRGRKTIGGVDYVVVGAGDISNNTTALAGNTQGEFSAPALILGRPSRPIATFGLIADSIGFAGNDTTGDADGNVGAFERGVAGHAYTNFSRAGDNISEMVSVSTLGWTFRKQLIALARPTCVFVCLGANDFPGTSWATFDAREALIVEELHALGVPFVGTTTSLPQTTSTDGFATLINQTPTAANVMLQQRNAALRARTQQAQWDIVVDYGSTVESAPGSGLWPILGSPDGTHPTGAKHVEMAAVVRPVLQARIPYF
ncbi:MAG: hypothetical protein JWQ16_2231 [Novosphingobium sp.]|nr:hypothetical protein [Novosphingobium sp.]